MQARPSPIRLFRTLLFPPPGARVPGWMGVVGAMPGGAWTVQDCRAVSVGGWWVGRIALPVRGAGRVRLGDGAGQFTAAGIAAEIGATGGSGDCSGEPGPKGPPDLDRKPNVASTRGIEGRADWAGLMPRRTVAKPAVATVQEARVGGVGRSRRCGRRGLLERQCGGVNGGRAASAPGRSRARRGEGRASGSVI